MAESLPDFLRRCAGCRVHRADADERLSHPLRRTARTGAGQHRLAVSAPVTVQGPD